MRILTIGCGYVGSVLAKHLSDKLPSAEIVISDRKKGVIDEVALSLNRSNVTPLQLDFYDYGQLVKTAGDFDILVGLAPGILGYETVRAAIEAGTDMVDLSYMPENPLTLSEEASKAGIAVIPDCGVAPGLSNILVGRAASMLDRVRDVRIFVGGLPQRRVPPLNYKVTWCVEDLIEEYTREAKIIKNSKTIEVDALEGLEELEFEGIGRLEAFYTDGVRTLHNTIEGVENMWEKTMRYPGHAQKIMFLRELGLFDKEPVDTSSPRDIMIKLFEKKMSMPEVKDLVAMSIEVEGTRKNTEASLSYGILDYYDEEKNVTAMGRTTGYTASAVVQLLAEREIEDKGIVPPEILGMKSVLFEKIMGKLREDGIQILERKIVSWSSIHNQHSPRTTERRFSFKTQQE